MGARVIEKQWMMRILVAKSMLEEELAKDDPSAASVAVLKSAVYGRDEPKDAAIVSVEIAAATTAGTISISDTQTTISGALEPEVTCEIKPMGEGNEGLTSDDVAMFVGDSKEEEDGSNGFSRSSSTRSHCESTLSRGRRKRPADESPEREQKENSRRDFPGIVTRSEGGCRIYVLLGIGVEPLRELRAIVAVTTIDGIIALEVTEEIVASVMTEEFVAVRNVDEIVAFRPAIFQIMERMEPPWITINVLDTAVLRFPAVDREILRLTIMTMMMTQRRCVVSLTRAGLRLGPRIDREGGSFLELDLDYADRYSTSH